MVAAVACVGGNPEGSAPVGGVDAGRDAAPDPVGSSSGGSSGSGPEPDSGLTCPGGQLVCGAACVDTSTSSQHCGACDRDCGGTTCTAGACGALTIQEGLATAPYGVAAAAGRVYWVRGGAVEAKAADGSTVGAATLLSAEVVPPAAVTGGTTLVSDGNFVSWLAVDPNGISVFSCSSTGCGGQSPKVGRSGSDFVQIALRGSRLFATPTFGGGTISTCILGQCNEPTFTGIIGTGVDPGSGLVASDTDFFFTAGGAPSTGGTIRCPHAGCPTPITARVRLFEGGKLLTLAGELLVASTSDDTLVSCNATAGCGGSPSLVAANQPGIRALAADETHVYFAIEGAAASATGEIRSCTLPDCAGGARVVASAQARPVSLVLQDGFLYWANAGLSGQSTTTASIRRIRP